MNIDLSIFIISHVRRQSHSRRKSSNIRSIRLISVRKVGAKLFIFESFSLNLFNRQKQGYYNSLLFFFRRKKTKDDVGSCLIDIFVYFFFVAVEASSTGTSLTNGIFSEYSKRNLRRFQRRIKLKETNFSALMV